MTPEKEQVNLVPTFATSFTATLPQPYVMVKRLPNGFVCGCLVYFRYLCVVGVYMHLYINGLKIFLHKTLTNMHAQIHRQSFNHHRSVNVAHFIQKNL